MTRHDSTALDLVEKLVALADIDTGYGDCYLHWARVALEPSLPYEDFATLQHMEDQVRNLPHQIKNALELNAWQKVQDLSRSFRIQQERLAAKNRLYQVGTKIYSDDISSWDPFDSHLPHGSNASKAHLPRLQEKALQLSTDLIHSFPAQAEFFKKRSRQLERLQLHTPSSQESPKLTRGNLQQQADAALSAGNFKQLEILAKQLTSPEDTVVPDQAREGEPAESKPDLPDLSCTFPAGSIEKAGHFGMVQATAERWHDLYQHLQRYLLDDFYCCGSSPPGLSQRLHDLDLPPGTPEALKSRVRFFLQHIFINSAGNRFIPSLVAEDLLVEEFPDFDPGSEPQCGPLLERLGLPRRCHLTRRRIERALMQHGFTLLQELGLDPLNFRLVCIPPDLHLRLGKTFGWGENPIWTHYDGYQVMPNRQLRALAGGDVRFGGIYDLVSLGYDYESSQTMVRFAIVQRKRMVRVE